MGFLKRHLVPLSVTAAVTLAIIVGGAVWWTGKQRYETTDNAFIQADKVTVAPQIGGYVAEVLVDDNQAVQAGQLLARLDGAEIQARLAQALANAAALEAAVRGVDDKARLEQALIAQRQAGLASAQAEAQLAVAEMNRYGALGQQGFVSAQRLQSAKAAAAQAEAAVAQARATLEAERRSAESLGSTRAQTLAQLDAARAAVEQARIDLSRTEIRAPVAGVIGARSVRPGQYVRVGSAMMSVVPLTDTYVVANFKETQVARLRLGQPVEIRADAFGKKTLKGKVESFAPATGAEFAVIPVENAVGNFTKITQRLPVRILVDRGEPLAQALRPGLSVHVKVDVTRNTGPSFVEAVPQATLAEHARTAAARP
ncbi:MAG: HlyD family secretion protein [Phenylobacterium sp.]|jgi:membrane fusion protein (multidrug efflux system)|uniref:HlyD family secretion protein n=1 Tax=Phenylobacterium sp. TaxID=1871053 RepID=UPI002A2EBC15|nr:HlyD family secretion protein [Phenylobacterium sp.]MDD3837663.1 HlyD family secretion protein [Phenylobacterium sp.]MDX9998439.1 HlyD family secretion protein [Phenylobacterium sp.]